MPDNNGMSKDEFWKRMCQIMSCMFVGLTLGLLLVILPGCNKKDGAEESEEAIYSASNSKCVFVGVGQTKFNQHTYREFNRYYCLEKTVCYLRYTNREDSGSVVLPNDLCREVELF